MFLKPTYRDSLIRKLLLNIRQFVIVTLLALMPAGAFAQSGAPISADLPPVISLIDINGVDLISGTFRRLIIGPSVGAKDAGGLGEDYYVYRANFGQSESSFSGYVSDDGNYKAVVSIGESSDVFDYSGANNYISHRRNGSTLVRNTVAGSSSLYTYTRPDGVVFTLDWNYIHTISYPTGEILTLTQDQYNYNISIYSNRGYLIHKDPQESKVYAINLSVDYCGVSDATCSSLTKSWPSLTFNLSSNTWSTWILNGSVSDSLGRSTVFANNSGTPCYYAQNTAGSFPAMLTITRPTGGNIVITRFAKSSINPTPQIVYCVSTEDGTWTYKGPLPGDFGQRTVTDPLGTTRTVVTNANGIVSDTDGNGRTTSYQTDSYGRITRVTYPEGNYIAYTYDDRGNVTQQRRVAKVGSGLADVVTSTTYDAICSQPAKCNKPNSITDARGGTTDLSYSPVHGLLLYYSSPADSAGIRPTVAYSYAQIATFAKNSAGSMMQVGSIWQRTGEMSCRTSAATINATTTSATLTCANGNADRVVTSISYNGSYNAQPTSVTVTPGDGSPPQVTTTTYDYMGNILSATKPNGN